MDVEQRARGLLAKKYTAGGLTADSERIRDGDLDRLERQAVAAIIAALTPPEGFVLVPVDLTQEMLDAGWYAEELTADVPTVWAALLSARPEVKP